jgi:hypothetical protein
MAVMNSPDFVCLSEMVLLQSLTSRNHRPNLMIMSEDAALDGVLQQLRHVCESPICVRRIPGVLDLEACAGGTLVLHDVAHLTIRQQIALFDWLEHKREAVQVVSVTAAPMEDLILDGQFLDGLFYRLNTVSVRATNGRGPIPLW